jgi:hypothetical protein
VTDPAARLAGALADRYRIERELGSGGMSTVYLAHDVRHDRKVAIKVLRPELAAAIGAERFLAEIKTTAHLQHPHILGLIDSGEVNGTVFYVMPFVVGESLRERLEREQQLPVADAVRIATQVANALDYAHRHGVIHRDIKPGNILLHDQQALVADFGIAIAASRPGTGKRLTETGMSVGTPHYMSPEQAMGERTLDARTDIYALGCVLYEMLTGEPPFSGPNSQAIIAKVMTVEPEPVTTVRKTVPTNVAAATMMAISKLPADRFPSAAALAAALENLEFSGPRAVSAFVPKGAIVVRKSYVWLAAAALVVAVGATASLVRQRPARGGETVARFEIPAEPSMTGPIVLSHDGSRLVWSGAGAYWERRLDSLGIRRLRDAVAQAGVRALSPDGRELLVTGRGSVTAVPLATGAARTLASGGGRGATWSAHDDYVYFAWASGAGAQGERGIARVRASGGAVDTVARFTGAWMIEELVALPGGSGLIAAFGLPGGGADSLATFDLRTRTWKPIAAGGPLVRYVEPGYLLYAHDVYLIAARFDAATLELGEAVPFVESNTGIASLAASNDVLVYRVNTDPLDDVGSEIRSVGGAVHTLPNVPDAVRFGAFTVAPDAQRFVATGTPVSPFGVTATQQVSNLYVYQLPSGPISRFPSNDRDANPTWIPGTRDLSFVRYDTLAADGSTLMRRAWDAITPPVALVARSGRGNALGAHSWVPRAGGAPTRAIVQIGGPTGAGRGGAGRRGGGGAGFGGNGRGGGAPPTAAGGGSPLPPAQAQGVPPGGGRGAQGPGGQGTLMLLSLDSPDTLRAAFATEVVGTSPNVSPDGRLVAFVSNASGRDEVYVGTIGGTRRQQVSLSGGSAPRWSRAGGSLFYRASGTGTGNDTIYVARVTAGPELSVSDVRPFVTGVNLAGGFGVLPGDTAFVLRPAATTNRRPLVVVLNFARELERAFAAVSRAGPR